MANFSQALQITLGWEGGLVEDPSDPGGLTKYGISKKSYPDLDIAGLTMPQAGEIYHRDYWRFDLVPDQLVANKLFDMSVNLGVYTAITTLQRLADIEQDGVWGPVTQDALGRVANLLVRLRVASVEHYLELIARCPALGKFREGWLTRACS